MMMLSTLTALIALLIATLVSSSAAAEGENFGLRNFEARTPGTPFRVSGAFGECTIDDDCAEKTPCKNSSLGCYCAKDVGDCDGDGRCKIVTLAATRIYREVCGCDGKTYANKDLAGNVGVNVKSYGACPETSSPSPTPSTGSGSSPSSDVVAATE